MEMILIPSGPFWMGENEDAHPVEVAEFSLTKYPVTNGLYRAFVESTGHPPPSHWSSSHLLDLLDDHPVVNISWYEANAYCQWLTQDTGHVYRLPAEAEWEKAARGPEGQLYPWGDIFDKTRCNTSEGALGATTPVQAFPTGASPYGVMDLVGNVWEWCNSLFAPYPYHAGDGREDPTAEGWRVLRGGSWFDAEWGARPARRLSGRPDHGTRNTGFRVVRESLAERR
jgi:formylglycine-generating enzyme required for sulfatase activity